MSQKIIALAEQSSLKANVDAFEVGDLVDVHTKILEGNKERIQIFSGTVIARSG
ncbi:MAG: 50S ribosomal protein L19, partial [Pirellulaceae bacterium]